MIPLPRLEVGDLASVLVLQLESVGPGIPRIVSRISLQGMKILRAYQQESPNGLPGPLKTLFSRPTSTLEAGCSSGWALKASYTSKK